MLHIKRTTASVLVVVTIFASMVAGAFLPVAVYANDGADDTSLESTIKNEAAEKVEKERQELNDSIKSKAAEALKKQREATAQKVEDKKASMLKEAEERRENLKGKLEDKKLEICKGRQDKINGIMNRSATRGQQRIDTIDGIATKVQEFYADSGLTVDNYDALVSDMATKKADADAAIAVVVDANTDFSCEGEDPKGFGDIISGQVKTMAESIKAYRDSVKDLAKSIKAAAEASNTAEDN